MNKKWGIFVSEAEQIKNLAASYTLTIDPDGAETIDGSATFSISSQYESITIVTDGSSWFII